MALLALFTLGGSNLFAQDVTATYITNADFEGEYSSYTKPKTDRDIYQPTGWTVTYTNGDENDMTSLNSSCTQWNQFYDKQQPTNGGKNTYWIRYRWGNTAHITLSQVTKEIPAGVYRLSFDAINLNTGSAKATVSVAGKTVEVDNRNTWATYGTVFTLQNASPVTITYSYKQNGGGECVAGVDNFKLVVLTQGATDITTQDWTTAMANAGFERGTATSNSDSFNSPYGFTITATAEGWKDGAINTTNPSEGVNLYNFWAGTTTSLDLYQTLRLPVGKYTISADLRTQTGCISNQGVYAKIGDNVFKSETILTIGQPWDGNEAWNQLSKDFYVDEEGSVQLGASSTGGKNSLGWFQIDNFQLTYKGAVQNTPYSIPSEVASAGVADRWYAVDISADGEYKIVSSEANTIKYTQRGALVPSDVTDELTFAAGETKVLNLTKGTLYLLASASATLTVGPNTYSYTVGDATSSVIDNDYTQNKELTITFANALTNDPEGALSLLDATKVQVNEQQAAATFSGNALTITLADELTPSCEYVVSIAAGAVGYNADNANTAISLTVKTPAVFDGIYFIATTEGISYISRGGDSNTEAALDKFGIAANFTTDDKNVTHITFVDNKKNLFGGSSSIYTDKNENDLGENAARARWTVAAVTGGYTLYSKQWNKYIAAGTGKESGVEAAVYSETAYPWVLEQSMSHPAKMTALKNANAATAATAAGITAANPAALNGILSGEDYMSQDITLTNNYSTISESYQAFGDIIAKQTLENLENGLYKVTLFGFQRITNNTDTYNYSLVGADNPTAYIYANDEKVQMLSPMSQFRATSYGEGWPTFSPEDGKYYPNDQDAAGTAYDEGLYKNEVFVYVTDGTLNIGVYSPANYKNANWISYRNLSVTLYKSYSSAWDEAHAAAEAARDNEAYANVKGAEKTALLGEIAKEKPTTAAGYEEAIANLIATTNAFIDAKTNYDALVEEIAYAKTINVDTETAEEVAKNEQTTAETAVTATQNLKVLEYSTIITAYPRDVTSMLGTWGKGSYDTTSGQSYQGGNETYFDKWSGSAADLSSSSTVTLPAGKYVVRVAGRGHLATTMSLRVKVGEAEAVSTPFFMIGDAGKGIDTNGATNFSDEGTYANNNNGRGWQYRYITFETNGEETTTIAISGHLTGNNWQSFYAPVLLCDEDTYNNTQLDAAKADLQNAIDQAPKAATSNVGTAAFQLPTDGVNTYSNALATAQAAHDDGDATLASIAAAKADLEAAIEDYNTLEVNAPADGQLFNVILTYDGWTYDNKAMTYIANGRTNQGNYNIQYKEEANKNLAQAFTFTKVEGNKYKMSQIDADGVARYISTGVPYGGNTGQIRTTTNADNALAVEVIPTATEGVWNLRNTAANNYIGSQDAGVFTVNSHIDFKLVETQKPSITINTTAAGWGTTILPFAVASIPEGVKVYSCPAVNGTALNLTQVDALEANKPYIIEGAWNATLTGNAQGIALNYTEGLLTGTYKRIYAPNGSYVLQKHDDKVAFFLVDTNAAQPQVPANRAYLQVTSEAKMFTFGVDATGISAMDAMLNGDAEIFNVSGVKQNSLQKGLNIIKMSDGTTHKVMVK